MVNPKEPAKLVFQGQHIRVREALQGGDICFVTFSSAGDKHVTGFGEAFLYGRGFSAVHLVTNWDHWYQPQEARVAAGIAKSLIRDAGFKKIITYGASMGGYAALAHSAFFEADIAIVIAPQFSIDGRKVPFEKRWRRDADKIDFIYDDMKNQISGLTKKYYIYDPNSDDQHHINLYSDFLNTIKIAAPFCGHMPGHVISHSGLLKGLIQDLATDRYDALAFRRALHLGRRKSPVYWYALGAAAMRSGRLSVALHAVEQGSLLAPGDLAQDLLRSNILLRLKRYQDAFDFSKELTVRSPKHPACWRSLSLAAQNLGLHTEAGEAARQAISLRPQDADLRRVLLEALMRAARFKEAADVGLAAIEMDPNFLPPYLQTADALSVTGNYDKCRELLQMAEKLPGTPAQKKRISDLASRIPALENNTAS